MTASPSDRPELHSRFQRARQVIGDDTLGWAIVGASTVARKRMVTAIRSQPLLAEEGVRYPVSNSTVVGIFSRNAARARQFADEALIPHAFVNLADLLTRHDIHCVYVCGHPRHHAQATLAAMAAGKHVLCETPMALSADDAIAMAHTAASAGVLLGVNYARRADPAVHTMRQMILGDEIGDILGGRVYNMTFLEPAMQTWRLLPGGGGVVYERNVHSIDLIRYLLRDEIASVYARSKLQILSNVVEEDVVTQMEMRRGGQVIQLHDSFLVPHNATRIELFGSAGTLVAYNCFVDEPRSELHLVQNHRRYNVPIGSTDPYTVAVGRFNDAVRGDERPLAGSGDGVQTLAVALGVLESIRTGRPISIPRTERSLDDRSLL